ncbi:unnamed protein product [Owenia fusiformis]|uniref:Uncharacterized protein n=1 Tax=Owenia fusiformis TaxID=6347 RepID=A0A8J1UYC8_OWEFU|nr:unnamed protein product [Owenia fusiformis]CAH1800476.1 unnamed protein product [Owenia fusiformis]
MSSGAGDGAPPSYEDVVKSTPNEYNPAYGAPGGQVPPTGQVPYPPPAGQVPYPPPAGQAPYPPPTGQAPYPQQPTSDAQRPYPVQPPPPPGYGVQPNYICGAQPVNYGNNVYSGQPGVVTIQNTQGQVQTQPMGNYRKKVCIIVFTFVIIMVICMISFLTMW